MHQCKIPTACFNCAGEIWDDVYEFKVCWKFNRILRSRFTGVFFKCFWIYVFPYIIASNLVSKSQIFFLTLTKNYKSRHTQHITGHFLTKQKIWSVWLQNKWYPFSVWQMCESSWCPRLSCHSDISIPAVIFHYDNGRSVINLALGRDQCCWWEIGGVRCDSRKETLDSVSACVNGMISHNLILHYNDKTWALKCLSLPATWFFIQKFVSQTTKKLSKLCITGPVWGHPPVTRLFPSQRASNVERISPSWRHTYMAAILSVNNKISCWHLLLTLS